MFKKFENLNFGFVSNWSEADASAIFGFRIFDEPLGYSLSRAGGNVIEDIPYQEILHEALREGGEFADLFFEQTHSVVIICEEDRIEKVVSGLDIGVGLRLLFDRKTFYGFTTELSKESLLHLARRISRSAREGNGEEGKGGSRFSPSALSSLPVSRSLSSIQRHPEKLSIEERISVVKRANEAGPEIRSPRSTGKGPLSGCESENFHFEFRGALGRRGESGNGLLCSGRFCKRGCRSNRL